MVETGRHWKTDNHHVKDRKQAVIMDHIECSPQVGTFLLPGTLMRARSALARSESLARGMFLADPSAPAVFGELQAAVAEMLRTLEAAS